MFKISLKRFVSMSLLSAVVLVQTVSAQDKGLDSVVADSKNDMLLVVGGGLAGAILGLSTLSFVDEPKDHTKNILVGASLGVIAGVIFVAYSQANKSRDDIYGNGEEGEEQASATFNTNDRRSWHHSNNDFAPINSFYQVGYTLNY